MRLGRAIGLLSVAFVLALTAGVMRFGFADDAPQWPSTPPSAAAAPSTTPPATTTTTTAPPPPEEVDLVFTGDLLPHTAVLEQARANGAAGGATYDFRPMFQQVRPILEEADIALCHLEVPLSADDALIASYPSFSSPRELGRAIADAGYEGCSTASNHSLDQRADGVVATLDVLDAAEVGHAGTARSEAEATTPRLYETADGLVVGHISAAYGFNGYTADVPWRVRDLDLATLVADARRARQAGADLVVASLHWGLEYQHDPTPEQLALARQLAESGAVDLIVGHHAHVVQPVRVIAGVPVIFGLGNFLSNMTAPDTRDGVIAHVHAVRRPDRERFSFHITLTPTWVDPTAFTIRPVARTVADPAAGALHAELRGSWARTMGVMGASGVATADQPLPP